MVDIRISCSECDKYRSRVLSVQEPRRYSRVDEVDGLRLELVSTVQVCQYQDVGRVLYRQVGTQRLLTHHLEPFQRILPNNIHSQVPFK